MKHNGKGAIVKNIGRIYLITTKQSVYCVFYIKKMGAIPLSQPMNYWQCKQATTKEHLAVELYYLG